MLAGKGEGPTLKSAFTLETCSLRLVYHGTLLFAIGMTEIYQLDYFVICNPYMGVVAVLLPNTQKGRFFLWARQDERATDTLELLNSGNG